jgi:hypothetical protein
MSRSRWIAGRRRWGGVWALAIATVAAGCSDDIVCPPPSVPESIPSVTARVVEATLERGDTTWVEVHVAADSLPTLLFASINDRQIGNVPSVDGFGLTVSLAEAAILWPPGNECSLEVTTNYGFASASEPVPSAAAASAPGTIVVGDSLVIRWTEAADADYYVVRATLEDVDISVDMSATVRDTAVTFHAPDIPFPGLIRGHVEAVAGPFPELGSGGNIGGAGWGYFTISYRDLAAAFEVTVADTGGA